ncbi:MAG: hypothetical protein HC873_15070 [Leptolyngbyaceae cyanobacterium SL_1_1]|nr:hypothetical protein [Leptolyngbyaceae cyanobacterium RM1_1_2]NJO10744.1 hypothetical protein [Leptolyngbyaceae cyanobacterium SL_1_1]
MTLPLILAIVILVSVFFWLRSRRSGRSLYQTPRSTSKSALQRQTRRELLRLTNGNQAVAQRLVERVREQHPDRSEQWCWEKAIYDIQRDRRA